MMGHVYAPRDASHPTGHVSKAKAKRDAGPPSPAQLAYIAKIAKDLGVATPVPKNFGHAGELIDEGKKRRQTKWDNERAARREAESDALESVSPWEPGRYHVQGEVVHTKVQDGDYGRPVFKMMLKDAEGRKIWLTVPQALLETSTLEELKGRHVSGVVTMKPKDTEPHFAFGSRPSGFGFVKAVA